VISCGLSLDLHLSQEAGFHQACFRDVRILKFLKQRKSQILTKDPLSVRIRNKRLILDPHQSASALNRPRPLVISIRNLVHYA